MQKSLLALLCALLGGCAIFGGPPVELGETRRADIIARLGAPAVTWQAEDGQHLLWPSGPNGTWTILAVFDAEQRLQRYENVLDREHFSAIKEGMSMDEVNQLIGPPYEPWTVYFARRDELVWEWRYCDAWGEAARFNVLFDGTSKRVRSTLSLTEVQHFGGKHRPCSNIYLPIKPAKTP